MRDNIMNDKTRLEWVWMRRRECGLKQLAFARIRVHAAGEGFSAGVWFPSAPQGFQQHRFSRPISSRIFSSAAATPTTNEINNRVWLPLLTLTPAAKSNVCIRNGRARERETRTTAWPVTSQKLGFDGLSRNLARKLFVGVVKDERDVFATINKAVILNFVRYQLLKNATFPVNHDTVKFGNLKRLFFTRFFYLSMFLGLSCFFSFSLTF